MEKVSCISCNSPILIPGVAKLGKLVVCPECESELEVVGLDPLELDWAFIDDWEEEEEEEYYYDEDY